MGNVVHTDGLVRATSVAGQALEFTNGLFLQVVYTDTGLKWIAAVPEPGTAWLFGAAMPRLAEVAKARARKKA